MKLTLRYAVFAGIAIAVNLAAQELSLLTYRGVNALYLAILLGTGAGLVTKYLLDKHYIFYYRSVSPSDDLTRFVVYSLTGVVTTLIFWGFELGFELAFETRGARIGGAVLGLTLGYILKYHLDRRYVFNGRMAS